MVIEAVHSTISEIIKLLYPSAHGLVFSISRPPVRLGDLSTNVSHVIAHHLKAPVGPVAQAIAHALKKQRLIEGATVQGGFINLKLHNRSFEVELEAILKKNKSFGSAFVSKGKKARVEFISANPTGPLHIGNARGGLVGDIIARILENVGYRLKREYFHNDVGGQVLKLGESIANVAAGQPLDRQEYQGDYIKDLAKQVDCSKSPVIIGQQAIKILLKEILTDAASFGVKFDQIYSESDLMHHGQTEAVIKLLRSKKVLKEKAGAIWFAPKDVFLKDRESVVIKSDNSYTYFANDIAYHNLKFSEQYDLVVDVLGPDHHGHILRIQAAINRLGYDIGRFRPVMYQWVRVIKGGQTMDISKRSGQIVTAKELVNDVGRDAFRFFMVMHDANTHLDFNVELAKKRSQDNPVYYVQYAVVRAKSILGKVKSQKLKVKSNKDYQFQPIERELILELIRLPELIKEISETFKVHQLTRYTINVAKRFHDFYEQSPVVEKESVDGARLNIVKATLIVLENSLKLLGVNSPKKM